MQFVKLYQNKQYIDQLCELMFQEWQHYGISKEYLFNFYTKQDSNSLPLTFLLLNNNILIGCFTLHIQNNGLTLSDVFVKKEFRNHGFGTMIVTYAKTYAFSVLHFDNIKVWVIDKGLSSFYQNLGFQYSFTKVIKDRPHIVMDCFDEGVHNLCMFKLLYIFVICTMVFLFFL